VTITEALEVLRGARTIGDEFSVHLACSFSPLHLKTLLAGHLQKGMPQRRVAVKEGVFGDLTWTIEQASGSSAVAIALEWQDLDPRLRYREGGAWGENLQADLIETAKMMLGRLDGAISRLPAHISVALSLPTLPLPPAFHTPSWQASKLELMLKSALFDFTARLAERRQLSVLSEFWMAESGAKRLDLKSDLLVGFPYTVAHADYLAKGLAQLLIPRQPLKGVITDLDNTFWSGLVGEVGSDSVRWDPATRYYVHGLYQKLLASLADEGILIGIASKNDPRVVSEALKRQDLLISADKIFPIEVHWAPKSESVTRILNKWNILADSVAFIDDTPLELAEVESVYPGITCLPFPVGDYEGVLSLLKKLRDLCGKSRLSEEDALRLESLRRSAEFEEQATSSGTSEAFLRSLEATVAFDLDIAPSNPRILELVNKTNQFNLNGVRLTPDEWHKRLNQPGAFVVAVKYDDKFGLLGTIGVVQGFVDPSAIHIQTWVMSCRAFSRRIEHQTIRKICETFDPAMLVFDFAPTAKNGPIQDFFESIVNHRPQTVFGFSRSDFEETCPTLYHRVEETSGVGTGWITSAHA
jgi:FkbH-like protein